MEKVAPELRVMYQEKEKFRDIFESKITGDEAFWKLVEWTESSYKDFPQSCQTIKRWINEIVAYFDHRTIKDQLKELIKKLS